MKYLRIANLFGAVALGLVASASIAQPEPIENKFLLIRNDQPIEAINLVQINEQTLVAGDSSGGWRVVNLNKCVGLLNPDVKIRSRGIRGLLVLSSGQRFPGKALSGAASSNDVFVWNHARFGRIEVPLDRVRTVLLTADAEPTTSGSADLIVLRNGDVVEGFVSTLGDPVTIDDMSNEGQQVSTEISLDSVASVNIVTPNRKPTGQRIWLSDGTVLDVKNLLLGDDGIVRLIRPDMIGGEYQLPLSSIAAIMFDSTSMTPFASLPPKQVKGPSTRYVVRQPKVLDVSSPLGLARVELHGPLSVSYALPDSESRQLQFVAHAQLPPTSGQWADFELVLRDDDKEVFRTRLNYSQPSASINVTLTGSVLSIQITEGEYGPIQDRVVLHRAMLLHK
ncbi:MAG: hypothetical protein IH984_01240 [Planctomycetes bacterium]|nr:hypothetical protein [Planctomycetota bacterium]